MGFNEFLHAFSNLAEFADTKTLLGEKHSTTELRRRKSLRSDGTREVGEIGSDGTPVGSSGRRSSTI